MFHDMVGGMPLNFKIVTNPKPETAAENTIWVNTDHMTGWIFSSAQPEAAEEGAVWFPVGMAGTGEFNALKKNGLHVCPLSARQLENGAWVRKQAQIYKGGWVDFDFYLYQQGDSCDAVTGGYVKHLIAGAYGDPAAEFLEDRIKLTTTGDSQVLVRTRDKIDLTHFSGLKLGIDRLNATANGSEIRFFVTGQEITAKDPTITDGAQVRYSIGTHLTEAATELILDVSDLAESMYVYVLGVSKLKLGTHDFCIREIRGM